MPLQTDRDTPGAEGAARKAHYGDGKQPWDTIVEMGWGAEFAAANVIKYLRRTKDVDHSIQSARWYYSRLKEMISRDAGSRNSAAAAEIMKKLMGELTDAEFTKVASAP